MRAFAKMPVLEVASYRVRREFEGEPGSAVLLQGRAHDAAAFTGKAHEGAQKRGPRVFKEMKPVLTHPSKPKAREVVAALNMYRETLAPARRHILDFYRPADVAFKVVGIGSVATFDYVVLCFGNGPGDPLFLQVKEEPPSSYAPYLKRAATARTRDGALWKDSGACRCNPIRCWDGLRLEAASSLCGSYRTTRPQSRISCCSGQGLMRLCPPVRRNSGQGARALGRSLRARGIFRFERRAGSRYREIRDEICGSSDARLREVQDRDSQWDDPRHAEPLTFRSSHAQKKFTPSRGAEISADRCRSPGTPCSDPSRQRGLGSLRPARCGSPW